MKVVFAGTPDFAVPTLAMLLQSGHHLCAVYTQPDRPAGRGRRLTSSPVKKLAQAHEVPVFQPRSLKPQSELEMLAALQPDLMVVAAYGLLLPQGVLDIPRLGCINVHASLLPRWRGAAPIQRAIMAGDPETGVTIMQMALRLDAGPMLAKRACTIGTNETATELHDRLARMGAEALRDLLPDIESRRLSPEAQEEAQVTYADKLEKAEAFLDWSQPARVLARQVRAFNAWPVAQTGYRNTILRIWQAQALEMTTDLPPGTVLQGTSRQLDVATGEGVLRLLELQLPGSKRMAVGDFLNSNDVRQLRLG